MCVGDGARKIFTKMTRIFTKIIKIFTKITKSSLKFFCCQQGSISGGQRLNPLVVETRPNLSLIPVSHPPPPHPPPLSCHAETVPGDITFESTNLELRSHLLPQSLPDSAYRGRLVSGDVAVRRRRPGGRSKTLAKLHVPPAR